LKTENENVLTRETVSPKNVQRLNEKLSQEPTRASDRQDNVTDIGVKTPGRTRIPEREKRQRRERGEKNREWKRKRERERRRENQKEREKERKERETEREREKREREKEKSQKIL
jgi:hypothetical protein